MKVSATIIFIFLTPFLWYGGYSREETSQSPGEHHQVVVPIKNSPQGKAETNSPGGEKKQKEGPGETAELHSATIPEHTKESSGTETEEREAEAQEEVTGYYIVINGEGLSSIAARDEVYGDPLKWPILYRHNMGKIGELQLVEDFLDRELPEGERLRIIIPGEARENLQKKANCFWVVNVLSTGTQKGLIPSAIRLMREGYLVYITSATVEGREWVRLRVGFFKTKFEANLERRKINILLRIRNSWITKVGLRELEEFGGY